MPQHINPAIRAREEAMEAAGLQVTLDSVAVVAKKAAESSGQQKKIVPNATYLFNNTSYTAK